MIKDYLPTRYEGFLSLIQDKLSRAIDSENWENFERVYSDFCDYDSRIIVFAGKKGVNLLSRTALDLRKNILGLLTQGDVEILHGNCR